MSAEDHIARVTDQLASNLRAAVNLKDWTTNPNLLGAGAEAWVRSLVRRIVDPMRVSTGTVVDYPTAATLPQIDALIWAPFPAPALFEVEDFAVVPRSSAFGGFEIKRSNYTDVNSDLMARPGEMASGSCGA
jgi:hypothetical protein